MTSQILRGPVVLLHSVMWKPTGKRTSTIIFSGIFNKGGRRRGHFKGFQCRNTHMNAAVMMTTTLRSLLIILTRAGWTNGLCVVLRPGPGRQPSMQCVSSQPGSSQRPDSFLTLYRNTIRPTGRGGRTYSPPYFYGDLI